MICLVCAILSSVYWNRLPLAEFVPNEKPLPFLQKLHRWAERPPQRNSCGGLTLYCNLYNKKRQPKWLSLLCWRYLFFRPVSRQVSSAQVSLTSVFGMGTGGPSLQSTPTYFFLKEKASKKNSTLFSSKKKGCDSITTPSKPNKVTAARSASACIPFLALNLRLQVKPSAY